MFVVMYKIRPVFTLSHLTITIPWTISTDNKLITFPLFSSYKSAKVGDSLH